MEKRKQKRVKTRQFARINGKLGVLSDMSLHGVQISTSLIPSKRDIMINLEVYGEVVSLIGLIRWIRRKNSLNSLNQLGVVLKNPPVQYSRFVSTLE
jgi:hypothetical protein